MRKSKSYEGFETWFNGLKMYMKMWKIVFIILFILHICISFLFIYKFHGNHIGALARYIIDYTSLHNLRFPDSNLVSMHSKYLAIQCFKTILWCSLIYIVLPVSIMLFNRRSKEQAKTKYIAGAKLVDIEEFKEETGKGDLPVGSFLLPVEEENKHCIAIGRTGAGKTVFFSQVVERLAERRAKAIIYDVKGDYTEKFYDASRDILFNPLDKRCTGWCVFDDIKTKLDINNVASSLIPPAYNNDSFWHDGARAVLTGILNYLWQNDWKTNPAIWGGVTAPAVDIHSWLQELPEGQNGFRYIEDHSSKQALGVFSTMMQYSAVFEYMSPANGFSITDWLHNDKGGFIFVTNQADTQDTLRPILSLFVDFLGKKLLSLPDDLQRRVFFMLDEFGSLQKLSSIKDLLTTSRSKGGSCWLGIQDMGQLRKLYTQDLAETIINACGTSVIFAVAAPDTAKYLVQKIGDTEFFEMQKSNMMGPSNNRDGVSFTEIRKRQPLLMNSQLMNLPDLRAYARMPNNDSVTITNFKYKKYPSRTTPFIIRDDLILENVMQRQQEIQEKVENSTGASLNP